MPGKREPDRALPLRRGLAVVLAVIHLAALACLAVHHHADPHDNAPCLVCASASAPAAQLDDAPAPAPPAAPAGPVVCIEDTPAPFFLPGSSGIRAPPAS